MTHSDGMRLHVAVEVLELGEMLFDTAIDAAARKPVQAGESEASLIEEMRSGAEEFFTALRLLLGVESN